MAESAPFLECNSEADDGEKYEGRSTLASTSGFSPYWKDLALLISTTSTLLLVFILFRSSALPSGSNMTRDSSLRKCLT